MPTYVAFHFGLCCLRFYLVGFLPSVMRHVIAKYIKNGLLTDPLHSLWRFENKTSCLRGLFCSLDETQKPPHGYVKELN